MLFVDLGTAVMERSQSPAEDLSRVEDSMTGAEAELARIETRLHESFAHLEANGTSSAAGDEFAEFLTRPGTLKRPSLIVRCRFDGRTFDCRTIVDKPFARPRLAKKFLPFLERIRPRLSGPFDVFVLISDMVHVSEPAIAQFVQFIRRAPFLRCDWLEGDPVSSNALVVPDYWLQDSGYDDEVAQIERAASSLPFERREEIIKWRGTLTGPDLPDLNNCIDFPRYRLLLQALRHPEIIDARLIRYDNIPSTPAGDALRRQLESWFGEAAPTLSAADFTAYKYLVSTDGVAATWKRVATILWTGSVLLMQHRWRQFFYPGLVAWEHYVPVANDLADLKERYDWLRSNPDRAASIGRAGLKFARHALTRRAIDEHYVAVLDRCARLPRT
jgi:Glycosyl transferase family 90